MSRSRAIPTADGVRGSTTELIFGAGRSELFESLWCKRGIDAGPIVHMNAHEDRADCGAVGPTWVKEPLSGLKKVGFVATRGLASILNTGD